MSNDLPSKTDRSVEELTANATIHSCGNTIRGYAENSKQNWFTKRKASASRRRTIFRRTTGDQQQKQNSTHNTRFEQNTTKEQTKNEREERTHDRLRNINDLMSECIRVNCCQKGRVPIAFATSAISAPVVSQLFGNGKQWSFIRLSTGVSLQSRNGID